MESKAIVKELVEFGLSEKEAQVYVGLLELDIATATEVAENSGVNRSSTYVVLEGLKQKGLVSTSEDKKVQRFVATPPEILLRQAEDRAAKAAQEKTRITQMIPDLKGLHKGTKHKPAVKVFEGKQGLIQSFENTLNNREKIMRVFSSADRVARELPDYLPDYVQRRIKLGIKMHGIHPDDKLGRHLVETGPKFDEAILVPKDKLSFPADIAIYDDKIDYMSPHNKLAISIQSREIADVMKSIFDLAFIQAKRIGRN